MAGPITLTRGQFAGTKAAAKPGATYAKYLSYVNAHRQAPASGGGGFGDLLALATKLYGAPASDASLQTQAQHASAAQINPLITNASDLLGKQSADTQAAIKNLTEQYAAEIGNLPSNVHADYGAAKANSAAASDALTNFLTGHGADLSGALNAKLDAINAPAASHDFANLNTTGLASGVAAANLARGANNVGLLGSQEGNQAAYADTLPGIVALAGIQSSRSAGKTYADNLAKQVADLQAQEPTLTASLLGQLRGSATSQRDAILHLANSLNDSQIKQELAGQTSADRRYGINVRAKTAAEGQANTAAIAQAGRDAAYARAQLAAKAKTGPSSSKAQSAVTHAFDKAAADAAKMYAGTYGTQGSSLSSILAGTSTAGPRLAYHQAYNAIYAGIEGDAGSYLDAAAIRRLTLRALARGGYPVTVTKGG